MMTGIIVVNEFLNTNKFNEIHTWLMQAGERLGIQMLQKTNAQLLIDCSKREKELKADFILFWDKDIRLAYYLEQLGYPVFNSAKAIELCDDKVLMHLQLMNTKFKMPKTLIAPKTFDNIGYTNYHFLEGICEQLCFPIIIKESFGSFGKQVYLANNKEQLFEQVRQIGAKPMLFQEFIKTSKSRDVRLQVVGGEVVAAMYRYNLSGDFRANLTIGASMQAYQPTKEQIELAIKSCECVGLDFGGVDLLFGEGDEPLLCEINSNAHFKNIYDCTGVNVADYILSYIKGKVKW